MKTMNMTIMVGKSGSIRIHLQLKEEDLVSHLNDESQKRLIESLQLGDMRKIERLWIKALETGIDDKLVKFLTALKVVKNEAWLSYMHGSHEALIKHRNERAAKKNRSQAISTRNSHYDRSPKSIKPTKQRRW